MKEATARQRQIVLEVSPIAIFKLFEAKKVSTGDTYEAPGGATLKTIPSPWVERRSGQIYAAVCETILVTFAGGVAINLFSAWLYDKLKDQPPPMRTLKINRTEVEITPEGIMRAIKESIEIEEKN